MSCIIKSIVLYHCKMFIKHCIFLQYIVESARQRPAKRRASSSGRKSLYQKLYELYIEECEKEPELKVQVVWVDYIFSSSCHWGDLSSKCSGHTCLKFPMSSCSVLFFSCRSWEEMSIYLRSWLHRSPYHALWLTCTLGTKATRWCSGERMDLVGDAHSLPVLSGL